MTVTVHFYGIVADIAKRKSVAVQIGDGATVAQLIAQVAGENPGFAGVAKQVRAVVNGVSATKETALADGDEVAFVRAIGGGA